VSCAEQAPGQSPAGVPPTPALRPRKLARRKGASVSQQRRWQLEMYQQVRELVAQDWTKRALAQHLHLHPHTVGKSARMEQFVDQRHNPHGSSVEPYRAYLQERWSQGCTTIKTLWQELCAQGFTGSYQSVWQFTRQWSLPDPSASAKAVSKGAGQQPRTPWQTKWLLLRASEDLSARDASSCQALYHLCPALAEAASLARSFVEMVRQRKQDQLDTWLQQASASPLPELHRFALGLRKEYAAMRAALSEPWRTGQVEGQITRLKYLKRQMYGRAHIDLLRLRVLHAA
jgi:transposase